MQRFKRRAIGKRVQIDFIGLDGAAVNLFDRLAAVKRVGDQAAARHRDFSQRVGNGIFPIHGEKMRELAAVILARSA